MKKLTNTALSLLTFFILAILLNGPLKNFNPLPLLRNTKDDYYLVAGSSGLDPETFNQTSNFAYSEKDELGRSGQASVANGTVTTTFNDYFSKHPLNKEMAMTFDAKWTEAVTSGEITRPNFDGTVKEVKVDPEPELDPGKEKFSK